MPHEPERRKADGPYGVVILTTTMVGGAMNGMQQQQVSFQNKSCHVVQ